VHVEVSMLQQYMWSTAPEIQHR